MKVIVTIQHPAHVHFFRNIIKELKKKGNRVWVFTRESELVAELLDTFGIEYTQLVSEATGTLDAYRTQLQYEWRLWKHARQIEPDVITAIGGIAAAHVSKLVGAKSIIFIDSGDHALLNRLGTRVADHVCTPDILSTAYGKKQIRYPGYHELSYLHPSRFSPDDSELVERGVNIDETYSVVRFVGWNAEHDHGKRGFSEAGKSELVDLLDGEGTVYITSESPLPDEFEPHRLPVPPEEIHNLLYYADLYVGDSQTMATEAAILGTPAIRSNSFAGEGDMDNFVELEEKYELLRSVPDETKAIQLAEEWITNNKLQAEWRQKRNVLLDEKIDVCGFTTQLIRERGEL